MAECGVELEVTKGKYEQIKKNEIKYQKRTT